MYEWMHEQINRCINGWGWLTSKASWLFESFGEKILTIKSNSRNQEKPISPLQVNYILSNHKMKRPNVQHHYKAWCEITLISHGKKPRMMPHRVTCVWQWLCCYNYLFFSVLACTCNTLKLLVHGDTKTSLL